MNGQSTMVDFEFGEKFDNIPVSGFIVEPSDTGPSVCKITDPRGFVENIPVSLLFQFMKDISIVNGIIESECIWAIYRSKFHLIPITSSIYQDVINSYNIKNGEIIPENELVIGNSYIDLHGKEYIYKGKHICLEYEFCYKHVLQEYRYYRENLYGIYKLRDKCPKFVKQINPKHCNSMNKSYSVQFTDVNKNDKIVLKEIKSLKSIDINKLYVFNDHTNSNIDSFLAYNQEEENFVSRSIYNLSEIKTFGDLFKCNLHSSWIKEQCTINPDKKTFALKTKGNLYEVKNISVI